MEEFIHRWNGKRPSPYGFFNTVEDNLHQDLDWFWKPWFFESGYPDLAIKNLSASNVLIIEKIGNMPIPVEINYRIGNGEHRKKQLNISVWENGGTELTVYLPEDITIKRIELGNDPIPDVNKKNNIREKE